MSYNLIESTYNNYLHTNYLRRIIFSLNSIAQKMNEILDKIPPNEECCQIYISLFFGRWSFKKKNPADFPSSRYLQTLKK